MLPALARSRRQDASTAGRALQGSIAAFPVVRIHPCGQVGLAAAGPSLVGLHGLSEVRVRKVAPYWFSASRRAVSAATRSSLPYRGLRTVARKHSSHGLARPFRAHRRATPVTSTGQHPPGLTVPYSASRVTGSVHAGKSQPRHLPPSAFLTLPAVYTPQLRSGLVSSR
jgi:hypothetical protein